MVLGFVFTTEVVRPDTNQSQIPSLTRTNLANKVDSDPERS